MNLDLSQIINTIITFFTLVKIDINIINNHYHPKCNHISHLYTLIHIINLSYSKLF